MINRKELQSLHPEERETTPDNGVTTYRSKSAASHERVPLQMTLWKAADRQGPHILDITKFGWNMKNGLPSPSLDIGPAAPEGLTDIVCYGCKASGKACSTGGCSCKGHNMSCTVYCSCADGDLCCNPLTLRNNAASRLSERDIGMHTDSDDDLDDMQLESA